MQLSKVQQFMVFVLGLVYGALNKRLEGKPIEITLSKSAFIALVQSAGVVGKKARAIYKNLETLEEKKLIEYRNKSIHLTPKGKKWFEKAAAAVEPYVIAGEVLARADLLEHAPKTKTLLSFCQKLKE